MQIEINFYEELLWPTVPSVTPPLVTTSLWLGAVLRAALFGVLTVTVWDLWERDWDHEFKVRRVHAAISVKFSVSSLAIIRFSCVMHKAIKSLTPNE